MKKKKKSNIYFNFVKLKWRKLELRVLASYNSYLKQIWTYRVYTKEKTNGWHEMHEDIKLHELWPFSLGLYRFFFPTPKGHPHND